MSDYNISPLWDYLRSDNFGEDYLMNQELSRLNKLIKKQEEIYHRFAKQAGLTDTQFWVLYALCEADTELCQNTFCENWCYSKQTVNTAVANLEKAGLLSLVYAEGSHKQKNITLTPAGEHFCDENIRNLLEAEDASLMRLSPEERETFFQIFGKMLTYLEQSLPDTTEPQ